MKVYKIRHKPTGLFFQPAKCAHVKHRDQLTNKGKIYNTKPSLSWLNNTYGNKCQLHMNNGSQIYDVSEFEIVEFDLI